MHELEKQALEDPFLADALEGYSKVELPVGKQLSFLQRQLAERIAQQQENKNTFYFNWQRLSVAAAACLLFVMGTVLFWMREQQSEKRMASQPRNVEANLTPADSIPGNMVEKDKAVADWLAESKSLSKVRSAKPKKNINVSATGEKEDEVNAFMKLSVDSAQRSNLQEVTSFGATVTTKDLEQVRPQQTNQTLQGRLPGVIVSEKRSKNEAKGEEIRIRGRNNLSNSLDSNASQPSIGWDLYNAYLQESVKKINKELVDGLVLLTFTVDKEGKPANIVVVKGLTDMANAEAIRLIKGGPLWQRRQDSTASVIVRFEK